MKSILALAFAAALLFAGCASNGGELPPGPPGDGNNSTAPAASITKMTFVRSPGYTANPVMEEYVFTPDGTVLLNKTDLRTGISNLSYGKISAQRFASLAQLFQDGNFSQLKDKYNSCNGQGFYGCPTDMHSFSITMEQGNLSKRVSVYSPADRPQIIDTLVSELLSAYDDSVPKSYGMTQELCVSARGNWNECDSACRGAPEGTICTMQCVGTCGCGGIAGFGCPDGFGCTDYLPKDAADAMGVCKPLRY